MTRKDYELIADTIRETARGAVERGWFAEHFADALAPTNPRFNRERFIAAASDTEPPLLATVENMERLRTAAREPVAAPGVFAYSPRTGERVSASPGDYFTLAADQPLKDADGEPMILAAARHVIEGVAT